MILNITRGTILLEIDGKKLTLYGEALLPGHGSPDFVVYSNQISHWDDFPDCLIGAEERSSILSQLLVDALERKINIEIE